MPWRNTLFFATVALTTALYAVMFWMADTPVRTTLGLLSLTTVSTGAIVLFVKRALFDKRLLTANFALGSIVHVVMAGIVVVGERLGALGLAPALEAHWGYFLVGLLGTVASLFTWSRAKGSGPEPIVRPVVDDDAPLPSAAAAPVLDETPDYDGMHHAMLAKDDTQRAGQLKALQRIDTLLRDVRAQRCEVDDVIRVVRQDVLRLDAESKAEQAEQGDDDVLSRAAQFFEWGAQKLPELAKMDVPDLLLAQAVAEIRATNVRVEHVFLDHRKMRPIHPINRPTAEAKADERAAALKDAMPLVEAHGRRLSEDLIAAHDELAAFKSVTGFQVVDMGEGEGYVTFEGNGRRAAIARALGDEALDVEVRQFHFADDDALDTIRRRIRKVQKANGSIA